jgi:hypothetical protein
VVTEEAARRPATPVFPTEADRSEASLLEVRRGIGNLWLSSQECVEDPPSRFLSRTRQPYARVSLRTRCPGPLFMSKLQPFVV